MSLAKLTLNCYSGLQLSLYDDELMATEIMPQLELGGDSSVVHLVAYLNCNFVSICISFRIASGEKHENRMRMVALGQT